VNVEYQGHEVKVKVIRA